MQITLLAPTAFVVVTVPFAWAQEKTATPAPKATPSPVR